MRIDRALSRIAFLTIAISATAFARASAQGTLVRMEDFAPAELRKAVFVLSAPQTVAISAVGGEPRLDRGNGLFGKNKRSDDDYDFRDNDNYNVWPAAAWILDARTRHVVWDLRTAETERDHRGVRTFNGSVQLPAGTYIAYYGSYPATSTYSNGTFSLASLLRGGRRTNIHYSGPYVDDGSFHDFRFTIRGEGRAAGEREADDAERAFVADAFATIRPDSGGSSSRVAFEVPRATDVQLLAIGELRRDDQFDYAWIQNADTHARVWEMNWSNTREAGGTRKNRIAEETLHLPAGRYVAYYVTDESHDPYDWNGVPPFDPEDYGLTLRVTDASARAGVHTFAWEPVPAGQTIVQMIGIGDNEMRSEGFSLKRAMDVRIYAIGEGITPDGDLDDRAWIMDASSRHRVWSMRYQDTEHAGGATKNRVFDGTIHLEPGNYTVYYASDDSHSFGHWNSAPPAEARYYGVSLFPASGQLDRSAIGPFENTRTGAIAELTRMRDDVRARRTFDIDHDQRVHVLAVGEGTNDEMDDWGWIEDAQTGRTVWEMSYHMTERAGGAEKNRMFDGTIELPAGHYVLHWQSDGSHSFGNWNADAPDDPDSWGISVLRADARGH
ncbi:MAG TPA: hypothetical protein VGI92_03265 [Gemmatimonadales bacterium]